MNEQPILMIAPMVRALLAGTKTQTRRVVKGQALEWLESGFSPEFVASHMNRLCPYGYAGDRLWVRETFYAFGRWETRFSAKKGRDEWHFIDMTLEGGHQYAYPADGHKIAPHKRTGGVSPTWWMRPSIFMPRAASRITLEVTGVRVERLQDISPDDCIAEGAWPAADRTLGRGHEAVDAYRTLWEQINGPNSWAANPWVWVLEFKRLTP